MGDALVTLAKSGHEGASSSAHSHSPLAASRWRARPDLYQWSSEANDFHSKIDGFAEALFCFDAILVGSLQKPGSLVSACVGGEGPCKDGEVLLVYPNN